MKLRLATLVGSAGLVLSGAVALTTAVAAPAIADTQDFGQTVTDPGTCTPGYLWVDPAAAAPADGTVTAFHFTANGSFGKADLQVLRPTGKPNEYQVIGQSGTVTDSDPEGNRSTVSVNIPVHAGDVLGTYAEEGGGTYFPCVENGSGNAAYGYYGDGDPAVGDIVTVGDNQNFYTQNLSATLGDSTSVVDSDGDSIADSADNCPIVSNAGQADADGDGTGDVCDDNDNDGPTGDTDSDGVTNGTDNCPTTTNPGQANSDADGRGDRCEATHTRSITLSATDTPRSPKLKLAGSLTVADTTARCVRGHKVLLARYSPKTKEWSRVATAFTSTEGDYLTRIDDRPGTYRVRVKRHNVIYEGFTSSCSAAATTQRHTH